MEPEEEGSRDEGEDAVRAMERPEAGAACSSPGSSGPEEPDGLAWCKLIGRGGAGRGGRSPGAAAAAAAVGVRPSPPLSGPFVFPAPPK